MDHLFAPMLYGHELLRDFGPTASPARKDQDSSLRQQDRLSPGQETISESDTSVGKTPKSKKHRRHHRPRRRRHRRPETEPKLTSEAVEQKTVPFHQAFGIHQLPPDQRLQDLTFTLYIRPKWFLKPMSVMPNRDGTYRFDYAPDHLHLHLHIMSYLSCPNTVDDCIFLELFRCNALAYLFFLSCISLEPRISNGVRGTLASRQKQSWDESFPAFVRETTDAPEDEDWRSACRKRCRSQPPKRVDLSPKASCPRTRSTSRLCQRRSTTSVSTSWGRSQ